MEIYARYKHAHEYYYAYDNIPDFLKTRRSLVYDYVKAKFMLAAFYIIILLLVSTICGRFFQHHETLYFISVVLKLTALLSLLRLFIRYYLLENSDDQSRRICREFHKFSAPYIGETKSCTYFINFEATPQKHYDGILLPENLTDELRIMILSSDFYKRAKRYTRSVRYRNFSESKKQLFLAAINEIIMDQVQANDYSLFHENTLFYS